MATTSAGLLVWRRRDKKLEVLIVHPGGPFWARKDDGAWSLPKGEFDPGAEDGLTAARREFAEELGSQPPEGPYTELGQTRMKSGKVVSGWAVEGELDVDTIESNHFEIEWPPRSGRSQSFPEVDRAAWVDPKTAATKLNAAQVIFVERLVTLLA